MEMQEALALLLPAAARGHNTGVLQGLTAPQCCEPEQLWQFQKAPYERNKDTTYSWRPCERWLWSHQSRPLGFSIVL